MFYILSKFFLSYFDSFNKKKICNFLKEKNNSNIGVLIDVGAHHGETIKIFQKNFKIDKMFAFEPSSLNFATLKKKTRNINNLKIFNIALGAKKGLVDFKQHYDSESSTLVEINKNSKYYKKKNFNLDFFNLKNKNFLLTKVKIDRLDNIISKEKIALIDILKIDTEGYDFHVIKGLGEFIKKVKFVYFEHHFHTMLKKNYNYFEVDDFLKKNNFKKVFKKKMFFRKTFEYIYSNNLY